MKTITRPPNPESVPRWEAVGADIVPSNTAAYAIQKNVDKGLDTAARPCYIRGDE